MTNHLKENAYHVLGLDTDASQKAILNRSKEILNRLQIDDTPIYDHDFNIFVNYRDPDTTKEARHRLSTPKKRLREYFFWFQIVDDIDKTALQQLRSNDFKSAFNLWKKKIQDKSGNVTISQKNILILSSLNLFRQGTDNGVKQSLLAWKNLIDSSQFWTIFFEDYKSHDDLSTSSDVMEEFKKEVGTELSDLYSEISQVNNNQSWLAEVSKILATTGQKVEKDVLEPLTNSIGAAMDTFIAFKVNPKMDGSKINLNPLNQAVESIQKDMQKLKDLGFYDSSQTVSLRDRVVGAIRNVALDLNNRALMEQEPLDLMEKAMEICGTTSLKETIKDDVNCINEIIRDAGLLKPIIDQMNKGNFTRAMNMIQKVQLETADTSPFKEALNYHEKACTSEMVIMQYETALKIFKFGNLVQSIPEFEKAQKMIMDKISMYSIEPKFIEDMKADIKKLIDASGGQDFSVIDEYRNELLKVSEENLGQPDGAMLIVLFDCHGHLSLLEYVKKKRRGRTLRTWVVLGLLIGFFQGDRITSFLNKFRSEKPTQGAPEETAPAQPQSVPKQGPPVETLSAPMTSLPSGPVAKEFVNLRETGLVIAFDANLKFIWVNALEWNRLSKDEKAKRGSLFRSYLVLKNPALKKEPNFPIEVLHEVSGETITKF